MPDRKAFTPIEFKLSETGDVSIAFSRFNVIDSDNDVTFPGSMPIGKGVPMSAYGHTSWDGAPPTGKGLISEKGDLGIFDGSFFMETDQGRNAYHTTKAMGDLQEWSYGYQPLDPSGPGMFDGKRVRELRKLDVFEVSPVLKGAGVGTATLAIKSGAPDTGTPIPDQLLWYAEGLPALFGRIKSHIETRGKDGRPPSHADRAALDDLIEAYEKGLSEARTVRTSLEPVDPAVQALAKQAEMDNLLAIARANGVPV